MDLRELGRKAALEKRPGGSCSGKREAAGIVRALRRIETARSQLNRRCWDRTPPGVEWLLDNAYLARREGLCAHEELRRGKALRRVGKELYIQTLAKTLAEQCICIEHEALLQYLTGIQKENPLTETELSLFISALRGELCRYLARLCDELEAIPENEELPPKLKGIFTSLRTLSAANLGPLLESVSIVEQTLLQDPAGLYQRMDEATRARYRRQVCLLSKRKGMPEAETAQKALRLAEQAQGEERHIGWFLFRTPLGETEKKSAGVLYVAAILIPALALALWLGFLLESWALFLLLLLPASDLMKNLTDFFAVRMVRPRPVLRMELKDGLPKEGRTLCVIAGLLTGMNSGDDYAALLERYRLANRDSGEELRFGLLADLPDRSAPMGQQQRQWVERAGAAINALNEKYGGGFYLFFRTPSFQRTDERYVGWERKRGALLELVRLLEGKASNLRVRAGNSKALAGTRYVITLDSDTALNVGTARELVGAMLHPLNRPRIDPKRKIVTEGYGLLQPRVGVELNAANRSQFSRIFAGQGGIDPYGGSCSDVYHDLFDRGTYTGKGIFDVSAFSKCLDGRFPEERVLSHDLLEGAYLHAGLLEDVELTDGYPSKVSSYFSRLHRWVRGDWQLLPWLGKRVKNQSGQWEENPITSVDRWKLFDNLRRSLSPISTLTALLLGVCLSAPAFGAAAALAIVSAWSNLLLSGAELAFRGGVGLRRRYHSTIIAGFGGVILQTLVQLLLLPYQAWICAWAICTALWRSFVSHKKMLEWVTAADTERKRDGLGASFRSQWPSIAAGGFAMAFARFPAGAAMGLVWALSPAFSWALSRPVQECRGADEEDRPFLLHQAALIWGYFQDWLRPEDHWLPPDNVQEKPWLGPARRTSPTNIGMALLSCVAAVDLELVHREQALEHISNMIGTLETLPKWNGHLYNWYDTSDRTPLRPMYVSTVDSGNLRGCLIALREALYEWGEGELARRVELLSNAMELSVLYDRERKLFFIGFDVERGEFTNGWYDLMASEARLSSYLAAALGEVDPRHWRRLGRGLMGDNDYCGMASWTGTMFEYFMPNLLLPCEPGSLMYESLSFCIYAQKRRGAKTKTPWGISESGFYAFDPGMAYQYKAHGVQSLGLRRGLDKELVIAPYASFLALLLAPRSAGRNLRRLRDMGMEGTYGLYEAADFTPSRLPEGEAWAPVRSFMSHHLGMSIIAIDNTLNANIMQERFLRDCSMGAFRELLQEKVPVGAPVMKSARSDIWERPRPLRQSQFQSSGAGYDLAHPACHLLSNGLVSALCTDAGAVRFTVDTGECPILCRFQERYAPSGVSFFYRGADGALLPLTEAPLLNGSGSAWEFDGGGCTWSRTSAGMTSRLRLMLPCGERGALWTVTLDGVSEGELVCYLEPVLAREADYLAHPAYAKLAVESHQEHDRGVVFVRRPRSGTRKAAMAVLWDREDAEYDTSREKALGRGGLRRLHQALTTPATGSIGGVLDPCLLLRVPVHGSAPHRFRLSLGFEDGEERAYKTAAVVLSAPEQSVGQLDGLMRGLQLSTEEGKRIMDLLSALAFSPAPHSETPQSDLWAYGVSGDLPLCVVEAPEKDAENDPFPLKAYILLTSCGFAYDLVYLLDDGGSYLQPAKNRLLSLIKAMGQEGRLGKRGGIHLIQRSPAGQASPWAAWAAVTIGKDKQLHFLRSSPLLQLPDLPYRLTSGPLNWETSQEGEFTLQLNGNLPPIAWSHLLVNPRFGFLVDETGCGHLWRGNAREGQLTPWCNDPLAVGGPEWFVLTYQGETHSLFADGDGLPVTVTYGFGWARWEKAWPGGQVRTTVLVPWKDDRRLLLVELPDATGELRMFSPKEGEGGYSFAMQLCLATDSEGTKRWPLQSWKEQFLSTAAQWKRLVHPVRFETPDPDLDRYLNGWCLYQVIACRLLSRTSRYQNGGAYGFRDQLQDVLALLPFEPDLVKSQLLRCCAHQFREGDVQHWWHEMEQEENHGVRTRISDDLLWLPFVLERYVEAWGDDGVLSEQVNYLSGEKLKPGENDRYFTPGSTEETEEVYAHALRAIHCALERGTGAHGLLKMGSGDWNDGMNEVGVQGRGESVWLTWFAISVMEGFLPLARMRNDMETEALCETWAERLRRSVENAWDGDWYLRGWYDDGTPLGSRHSDECRIDSIAQSWAVLAGGEPDKAARALRAALDLLFDRKSKVIKLFSPPFDCGQANPGYIKAYLPGIRENGGQYTHAAAWMALACFRIGWGEEGYALLHAMLPTAHPQESYQAEPYVLAGDVYSHPEHLGRGGWSWYTGAAGWFQQTALGGLLGIRIVNGHLSVDPHLPDGWPGCSIHWQGEGWSLAILLERGKTAEQQLDGQRIEQVELRELTGEHTLKVTIAE